MEYNIKMGALEKCWNGVNLVRKTGGLLLSGSCLGYLTDQPGFISRQSRAEFVLFCLKKKHYYFYYSKIKINKKAAVA